MNNFWDFAVFSKVVESEDGTAMLVDNFGIPIPDEKVKSLILPGLSVDEYFILRERAIEESMNYKPGRKKKIDTKKSGYIYAVLVGNKLKLGRTVDLESRFKSYKRVSDSFKKIASIKVENYTYEEKVLLEHFGGLNNRKEWFDYAPELEVRVVEYFRNLKGAGSE